MIPFEVLLVWVLSACLMLVLVNRWPVTSVSKYVQTDDHCEALEYALIRMSRALASGDKSSMSEMIRHYANLEAEEMVYHAEPYESQVDHRKSDAKLDVIYERTFNQLVAVLWQSSGLAYPILLDQQLRRLNQQDRSWLIEKALEQIAQERLRLNLPAASPMLIAS